MNLWKTTCWLAVIMASLCVSATISDDELMEILHDNAPTNAPVNCCAVVYRVADGARIAMANIGAITTDFAFEPGSIIKPVSVIAAMECGVAIPNTLYDTKREDSRYVLLPGDGAHIWPEKMSVADALVRSSNVVIGKLGYDVGPKNLLSTFAAFGIGSQGGELPKYDHVDKVTWSRLAIGQGFTSTLDEMARTYVVLANHGKSPWTKEQIVPKTTADAVALVLRRVPTNEGTARRAAVHGLTVAGKTGTAQMIEGNRYVPRYHGTFIGFFPAEEPRFVVAVLSRSNIGQQYYQGGHYPALAFAEIAKRLLPVCDGPTKESCAVEAERQLIAVERVCCGKIMPASNTMSNSPNASFSAEYDNPIFRCPPPSSPENREVLKLQRFIGELFAECGKMGGYGWGLYTNRIENAESGVERVCGNLFRMYKDSRDRFDPLNDRSSCSWDVTLDGQMVWEDSHCLSYRIRCVTDFGGMHPDVQIVNGVYNRRSGKRLKVEDIIKEDSLLAVLNLLRASIARENSESEILAGLSEPETRPYSELRKIRAKNEADTTEPSNIPFLTENFYLNKDGITWTFDEYELSSYGDGCPQGTVVWQELEKHLKDNSIVPAISVQRVEL